MGQKSSKHSGKNSGGSASGGGAMLDLHGFAVDDVFDAVEKFLLKHQNANKVRIMPGKGTGKVKAKVIEYLKLANYHWSYEPLAKGGMNDGVLIVYME